MPDLSILGRSVVVSPGSRPPAGWDGCDRVAVTAIDTDTADALHLAWRERRPLVVELTPGIGLDDPAVAPPERIVGLEPWEWSVDLDLPGERLHHAVWANAVDHREGQRPSYRWAAEAVGLGARGAEDPAGGDRGAGVGADVVLPDGRPAICDGGPLDIGLEARAGTAVVHRVALEHGSLVPLRRAGPEGVALAADQLAAVGEPTAGARIIAPAGSGKTRVLTERARLVAGGWGVPAAALALVAYNVRAAGEMRDRLADLPALRIRTLNAMALRLSGRSTTIEALEVRRLLSALVSFPRKAETDPAAPWIEALSRLRLGLAPPEAVEEELPDVSDLDSVARRYRKELAQRDAADFDEQITASIARLLSNPAFRARSQRFARVLLVDEFQDLTPAHLLLLRLLSGPAGSVFAVGDDDQTIYGYAGATPRWLVDFERWFPGSAQHSLQVNYRCPPPVVTAAANLLTRNALRVPKTIEAGRPPAPSGAPPALTVLAAGDGPARRTAGRVEELVAAGADPGDVAVLGRTNSLLVPVQVLLSHRGVPVRSGGDPRFLQRGGVRGALAWLEVATAPDGSLPAAALREAARRPKRGMSNSLLDLLGRRRGGPDALDGLATWLEAKGSAREATKVTQLASDVSTVRRAAKRGTTASILQVVRTSIGGSGLDASASALDQWSHGAISAHLDDLEALSELADLEPDPQLFPAWLADRLAAPPSEHGVTVASIHAVKGREWPHVIVHHVTDGLLPHRLSEDQEEERRVFHVGLTRAGETATVVAGNPPSPFLDELAAPAAAPPPRPSGTAARERRTATPARATKESKGRSGGGPEVATLLPATPQTEFRSGGHDHEVVEAQGDEALTLVGGGPARMRIRYGTVVSTAGGQALLAHPAAEEAGERLREWRAQRARTLGVPAYVVFDDKTLRQLAALLPVSEAALLSVHGIGPVKLEAYGAELLALSDDVRRAAATEP